MLPRFLSISLLLLVAGSGEIARAVEAGAGVDGWSAFTGAEADGLQPGSILIKSNASMPLPRGLSAQAIYVVDASPETAVEALKTLDPTRHAELEVYQHHPFRADEDPRFAELKLDPKAPPFQHLLEESAAPKHLQLSKEERAHLPRAGDISAVQQFWANLLPKRLASCLHGGEWPAAGDFDSRGEIRSLLRSEPKLAAHFAALFEPWTGQDGSPGATATLHYWDVSKTDGLANLELGAIFERSEGGRRQVADVTYYSSSGYIAAVTFFEFIPLGVRTLVWHGTLVSSAEVAGAFGIKRKFAIGLLEGDMRQWIGIFRRACMEGKK